MLTIDEVIASCEKSAERYHKAFLRNKAHGGEFYQREAESDRICEEHERQLAAWLRELQERRKADSCEGCVKEFGKGYLLVCTSCKRNYADLYEPERRTDE